MKGNRFKTGNACGGLLLIMIAIIGVTLVVDIWSQIKNKANIFTEKGLTRNSNELMADTRTAGDFSKSLRFAFGAILPDDIDVVDNDYFEFKAYRMVKGDILIEDSDYEIVRCSDEYKESIVLKENFDWYPNSLCIKNQDKMTIKSNWFTK